ncbi:hypothetical protein FHX08_003458 [Rhizobium sp. BK529]|uniref:hypothetical protein n=1 Tax=unclassified Rhizobium TaxID=2613769 RepID=UPI00104F98AB|nr:MULTISPECIES: hypothetical protein [unclassified Rhizobium]MBB3593114.1 hypothetical protein [Rhizobium sp. BK529]TCS07493.1 hypothetical protein EV281_1021112 [Rhizobium sp. BK418]
MHLVRDVLDKQLVDQAEVRVGRADGIILHLNEHGQPKVVAIELGWSTLARRLLKGVGLRTLARDRGRGYRIAWSHVADVGVDITIDVDRQELPLERWQQWLRRRILGWIPGGLS